MRPPDGEIASGLVYYPDSEPGIRRHRRGRGFSYVGPDGTRISRGAERKRLDALAVPPAYADVWISPLRNGHLQATGQDERERKQYRYHQDWTEWQARRKYEKLAEFGEALPSLRRWISSRLGEEIGSRDVAIAATLSLIDRASLRIGNAAYTEANGSYGATTLLSKHVKSEDGRVTLDFTGKGGAEIEKDFYAPRLADVLEESQDLPGAAVLTYVDADGASRSVRSEQVNEVLATICGEGFTAKTFRTWNGTHSAFLAARKAERAVTIKAMAEAAAERIHNTATIARNSYIHPAVIDLAEGDDGGERARLVSDDDAPQGLRQGEAALLRFLKSG